ncbi:hypothetical protein GIB67_008819 [Kingdonia uniflora]|uniref:Argonaute 1 n=1 Tax=Kingdonia uniflora TaxID=39325 RepID=A0A7J7LV60_9MAGN|nr:hypothetical protein GIB67_008819 [Kingdonia uniflora]
MYLFFLTFGFTDNKMPRKRKTPVVGAESSQHEEGSFGGPHEDIGGPGGGGQGVGGFSGGGRGEVNPQEGVGRSYGGSRGRGGRGSQGTDEFQEASAGGDFGPGYVSGSRGGGRTRGGGRGGGHGPQQGVAVGSYGGRGYANPMERGPRPSQQGGGDGREGGYYGGRGGSGSASYSQQGGRGGLNTQGRGAPQPRGLTALQYGGPQSEYQDRAIQQHGVSETAGPGVSSYPGGSPGPPIPELYQATISPLQQVVTQAESSSRGDSLPHSSHSGALAVVEQFEHLSVSTFETPASSSVSSVKPTQPSDSVGTQQQQEILVSTESSMVPVSSKSVKIPGRPGLGQIGKKCLVKANHFSVELPDKELCHYDIVITPEVSSRAVNRIIMKQLVTVYRKTELGNRLPAYDGRKSLYTAGPLPFQKKDLSVTLVDEDDGGPRRERQFIVTMNRVQGADLHSLGLFLQGKIQEAPQDALQVLDIVLREFPTSRYVPVGRSFYHPTLGDRATLGEGLESWRGFYQSIRPTQMGLSLNIDMSSTAFIEPHPVIEFVCHLLNRDAKQRPLTDLDRAKIKKALRGVKVEVTHRGNMRRKYRISGLTTQSTRELTFPVDEHGAVKSVVEYFRDTYHIDLEHTTWPCLQVGSQNRANYLPMEVCKIVEGQRYTKRLNEKQITNLLKVTCQRPKAREIDICNTVKQNAYDKDEYAKEFGIKISNKLTTVEARVLNPPLLKYHASGITTDCYPVEGQWNMQQKRMVNGGTVKNWICINYSRLVEHRMHGFCAELAEMCNTCGMNYNPEPVLPSICCREPFDKCLKKRVLDAKAKLKGEEIDLLIFILPDNNGSLYGDLKRLCETNLGIVSQCCLQKHAVKSQSRQYLANVALKINVKVGGRNTVLADALYKRIPLVSDKATIIFGADVTHPPPGEDSSPSIAAVVASQDWPEVTKYAGLVSAQGHRKEIIDDLYTEVQDAVRGKVPGGMVRELLKSFYQATRVIPQRIIFYRDGVSEGQFYQVLLYELDAIRRACASIQEGYMPPVTFIVVQKRHHTRLFANNHNDRSSTDRSGNILPGTVVDTKICHPTEFDFYLCSHAGIQGTSRPAHYHVLWDENKFSADGLQSLTNNLYARCTRSVSIVPPAYYAHLAAFRARFYVPTSENSDSGSLATGALGRGGGGTRTTRGAVQNAPVRPLPPLSERVKKVMFYC